MLSTKPVDVGDVKIMLLDASSTRRSSTLLAAEAMSTKYVVVFVLGPTPLKSPST